MVAAGVESPASHAQSRRPHIGVDPGSGQHPLVRLGRRDRVTGTQQRFRPGQQQRRVAARSPASSTAVDSCAAAVPRAPTSSAARPARSRVATTSGSITQAGAERMFGGFRVQAALEPAPRSFGRAVELAPVREDRRRAPVRTAGARSARRRDVVCSTRLLRHERLDGLGRPRSRSARPPRPRRPGGSGHRARSRPVTQRNATTGRPAKRLSNKPSTPNAGQLLGRHRRRSRRGRWRTPPARAAAGCRRTAPRPWPPRRPTPRVRSAPTSIAVDPSRLSGASRTRRATPASTRLEATSRASSGQARIVAMTAAAASRCAGTTATAARASPSPPSAGRRARSARPVRPVSSHRSSRYSCSGRPIGARRTPSAASGRRASRAPGRAHRTAVTSPWRRPGPARRADRAVRAAVADSRMLLLPSPASPSMNSTPPRPRRADSSSAATTSLTPSRSRNGLPIRRPLPSSSTTHRRGAKKYDDRRMLGRLGVSILDPCRWPTPHGSSS